MTAHLGAILLFLFGLFGQPQMMTVRVTYYLDHGPNRWGGQHGCPLRAESGGGVATDPRVIPPGSLILISGVGLRRACDTGGGVKDAWLDIWAPSRAEGQRIVRTGENKNVLIWRRGS